MGLEPQNIDVEWRYSKAIFDPNMWHEISEARVDWLWRQPFSSNLHSLEDDESTIEIKGLRPQVWQMLPVDGVAGRYAMRSNYSGPDFQMAACYKKSEADSSKTGICLVPSTGEDSQKWDVDFVETTGSTYIFRNVENGTDFVLDCHPGNPIFMNANFDPANNPAQHWILRPDSEVNNEAFSTTFTNLPAGSTNKPLPSNTGDPYTSESPRGYDRPPMSTGAVAGVGVGSALIVLMLAGIILAIVLHRKKSAAAAAAAGSKYSPRRPGSSDGQPAVATAQTWSKSPASGSSAPEVSPDAGGMSGFPQYSPPSMQQQQMGGGYSGYYTPQQYPYPQQQQQQQQPYQQSLVEGGGDNAYCPQQGWVAKGPDHQEQQRWPSDGNMAISRAEMPPNQVPIEVDGRVVNTAELDSQTGSAAAPGHRQ